MLFPVPGCGPHDARHNRQMLSWLCPEQCSAHQCHCIDIQEPTIGRRGTGRGHCRQRICSTIPLWNDMRIYISLQEIEFASFYFYGWKEIQHDNHLYLWTLKIIPMSYFPFSCYATVRCVAAVSAEVWGRCMGWEVIVPLHNNDNVPAETSSIETLPDILTPAQSGMLTPVTSQHVSSHCVSACVS